MKICFFIGYYPNIVGGAEYQSRIIADELSANHEIFYISPADYVTRLDFDGNYKIYRIRMSFYLLHKLSFYYFYMRKINKIIRSERPNIVYQRVLNSFSFFIAKSCKRYKIPFILHIADDKCLKFSYRSISSIVRLYLFKRLNSYNPIYICQTDIQKKLLNSFDQNPELVIPNISRVLDYSEKNDTHPRKIVWIANVRPFKRLDIFLDLVEKFPDHSIEFHIIGSIPDNSYGQKLKSRFTFSNLFYHGSKSNDYINDFLKKSFVLINTSDINTEGFPNTFIQAWMTGTPVISFGNNPNNYIDDYGLGYYSYGNIKLLEKNFISILSISFDEYSLMSRRCRDFAINNFSINQQITKLNNLFNRYSL